MTPDPISDMLARIRNAAMVSHRHVEIPGSSLKRHIGEILVREGFADSLQWIDDGKQGVIQLRLRYDDDGQPVIHGMQRKSRPGRRYYVGSDDIPRVQSGLGVVIVSTSRGVMTGKDAREQKLGGEVLCAVW